MSKNILIFSDGTGQAGVASDEGRWSNIYKLYRATRVYSDTRINPVEQVASMMPGLVAHLSQVVYLQHYGGAYMIS